VEEVQALLVETEEMVVRAHVVPAAAAAVPVLLAAETFLDEAAMAATVTV
jgi:hypothetical protein